VADHHVKGQVVIEANLRIGTTKAIQGKQGLAAEPPIIRDASILLSRCSTGRRKLGASPAVFFGDQRAAL